MLVVVVVLDMLLLLPVLPVLLSVDNMQHHLHSPLHLNVCCYSPITCLVTTARYPKTLSTMNPSQTLLLLMDGGS